MDQVWWEQVGPRRFCTEVVRYLRNTSVAACFSQFATENLLEGIDGLIGKTACFIDADHHANPADLVKAELGDSDSTDVISALADREGIVVVNNVRHANWAPWCTFVEDYHRGLNSQKRAPSSCPRFLLIAKGISEEVLRPVGVDLKIVLFKNRITCLDTEQYCAVALSGKAITQIEQRARAAIVAELALWDKALADRLCGKDLSELMNPISLLSGYAEQRKLTATGSTWHLGTWDIVGSDRVDSALVLALRQDLRTIENRIWRAQLRVFLPYIEERRCEFVDVIREQLSLPAETNLNECEFMKLRHLLGNHLKNEDFHTGQLYLDIAEAFGKVRNELAHRRPATASFLDRMFQASSRLDDLKTNGPIGPSRFALVRRVSP